MFVDYKSIKEWTCVCCKAKIPKGTIYYRNVSSPNVKVCRYCRAKWVVHGMVYTGRMVWKYRHGELK
jgi:NAD-dependent SIR2 family protein deacetylase